LPLHSGESDKGGLEVIVLKCICFQENLS
jgi:hypothetical protein